MSDHGRGKSKKVAYFSSSSIVTLAMRTETKRTRQDVLDAFLQTDVVMSAPKCLYIYHFPGVAVELFNRPECWYFHLAYEFAPCHASLLLYFDKCRIVVRSQDRVRRSGKRDRCRWQERIEQDIQQGTRVSVRNIHVVLAMGDEQWNVDIVDYRKRVELVSDELLDQL